MKKTYKLKNLHCANCATKIEDKLNRLAGVEYASIGFMTQRLSVEATNPDALVPKMQETITKIEKDCEIIL